MTPDGIVLIAGAGWRVWRFVVPALLNEGVARAQIVVLRRSKEATPPPMLAGLRIVQTLHGLQLAAVQVTINCVSAPSLLEVQAKLVAAFPKALHFCDTPIWGPADSWLSVIRMSRRVWSLEDWPLLPNIEHFASRFRSQTRRGSLSFEHFGIPGHFLAALRSTRATRLPSRLGLFRTDSRIVAEFPEGSRVEWKGPKQFLRAKIAWRTDSEILEDFHEVESRPHSDTEVLYRVIDASDVTYRVGESILSRHMIRPELLETFHPLSDRQNVHELDKFIALTRLFRSMRTDLRPAAYPYLDSARDAYIARNLEQNRRSRLW